MFGLKVFCGVWVLLGVGEGIRMASLQPEGVGCGSKGVTLGQDLKANDKLLIEQGEKSLQSTPDN